MISRDRGLRPSSLWDRRSAYHGEESQYKDAVVASPMYKQRRSQWPEAFGVQRERVYNAPHDHSSVAPRCVETEVRLVHVHSNASATTLRVVDVLAPSG